MTVLVIALVALAVIGGVWYAYYRKQQRRQALAAFAGRYGLQYSQEDPYGLIGYGFQLFQMGDGRGCENVVSGAWQGLPVREADYWYYDQSTDSKGNRTRTYHYFSVAVAEIGLDVPYVSVRKENLFARLADHLGFRDVEFESEDFNREFQVKSKDREFAFKLVDARMIQWLLSTGGRFGFEVDGANLLTYCKRVKPDELVAVFGTSKAFADHVPSLVHTEYGGPARPDTGDIERSSS